MSPTASALPSVPRLYNALRDRLRPMEPVLDALEEAYVALRYRQGEYQTIRWGDLTITESRYDPYVRRTAFGRMSGWVVHHAMFRGLIPAPSPVIIDVGANIGIMTLLLARLPGATVYAFEPGTRAFECLRRNVAQNGLTRVTPIHAGLSDKEGDQFLGPPSGEQHPRYRKGSLKTGVFSVHAAQESRLARQFGEMAHFSTLDAFCEREGLQRLDFIKIDVEGHEPQVLQGGCRTLQRLRPVCQVEFNTMTASLAHSDPGRVFTLLQELGYGVHRYDGHRLVPTDAEQLCRGRSYVGIDLYAIPAERRALLDELLLADVWSRVRGQTSLAPLEEAAA